MPIHLFKRLQKLQVFDDSEWKMVSETKTVGETVKVSESWVVGENWNYLPPLCFKCNHILRFHYPLIYYADDPNNSDLLYIKCSECECQDIKTIN